MEANSINLPVSNGHLNRLMRARKINVATQRQAQAFQSLRSLHPNHVHQVDPSLCVPYYLPSGEQRMMEADKFYKNKWENYAKVALKVWRYVLYDHRTALLAVRYYEAAGENAETLFDFLVWAWSQQPGREFHGVPQILMWEGQRQHQRAHPEFSRRPGDRRHRPQGRRRQRQGRRRKRQQPGGV